MSHSTKCHVSLATPHDYNVMCPTPMVPCGTTPYVTRHAIPRGGKIGPTRWASSIRPKLRPGWAIKLLAQKKSGQIWPGLVWPGPAHQNFFCLKRLFGPPSPVFRVGWVVKILARKNRANFDLARFWPGLAQPGPPDCHL